MVIVNIPSATYTRSFPILESISSANASGYTVTSLIALLPRPPVILKSRIAFPKRGESRDYSTDIFPGLHRKSPETRQVMNPLYVSIVDHQHRP